MQQIFTLQVSCSEQQLSSKILIDTVYRSVVSAMRGGGNTFSEVIPVFSRAVATVAMACGAVLIHLCSGVSAGCVH